MGTPKVSIIIPTYNSERFLRPTVESALNQDHDDYEIVVVDDGSTDGTREILESFDSPRVHVFFEEHAGCAANYNRCLERTSGEYIAILDHDDLMHRDRIRMQAEYLDRNRGIYIVGSNYEVIDEEGNVTERKPMPTGADEVGKYELVFNAIQHPTAMYRRRIFELIDIYDESYYPSHDSEFILRAIQKTAGDNIPEYLTQWRRVTDSPTNSLTEQQHKLHYQMRKDVNAAKYHAYIAAFQKRRYALNLCKIAYYYGDGKEARKWAWQAMKHRLWTKELFRYYLSSMMMPLVKRLRKRNIVLPFLKTRKESSADWTLYSP